MFFSSHPNPENRIQNINTEIGKLGTPPARTVSDSAEFRSIQRLVKSIPPAPKAVSEQPLTRPGAHPVTHVNFGYVGLGFSPGVRAEARTHLWDLRPLMLFSKQTTSSGKYSQPAPPSSEFKDFDSGYISLSHPDNWRASGNNQQFTLVPDGGIVSDGNSSALAYGATAAIFTLQSDSDVGLREATSQLIARLQRTNSNMRVAQDRGQVRIGGRTARWNILSNNSPIGGQETDWLITVLQPEGLVYFILVAPAQEFADYEDAFRQIINSVTCPG